MGVMADAQLGDFAQHVERYFCLGRAAGGEDSAADCGVWIPGDRSADLRQTGTGALNPFDLVVLLSLSNTVQNAIIGNDNSLSGGLIGAFTLLAVNYLVVRFLFRHRRLDQMFEGKPLVLIESGKMIKRAMAKELLTRSD